jgi:hypothetical protein
MMQLLTVGLDKYPQYIPAPTPSAPVLLPVIVQSLIAGLLPVKQKIAPRPPLLPSIRQFLIVGLDDESQKTALPADDRKYITSSSGP